MDVGTGARWFAWAVCVALAAGGCRAGTLDVGSPDGYLPPGGAGDGGTTIGGPAGEGAPADAGSPLHLDGAVAGGSPSPATGECVAPSSTVIRLLSPQSGSTVTSSKPQFRWTGGTGPYRLQVCADRACDRVLADVFTNGTETALSQAIPPGYWFWRVRAAPDAVPLWTSSWEMRVRRRFSGYAPVANTSVSGFSDYDGDGNPDVAAFGAAPMIYLGGPDGLSASRILQTEPNSGLGRRIMEPQVDVNGDGFTDLSHVDYGGLGDFDGDGFGELIKQSRYAAVMIRGCAPTPPNGGAVLECGPCQLQQVATGDFNGDGRTDVIFADNGGIALYMGNPNEPTPIRIPGMSGLWVIDFNYDGYSDLVIKDQWPANTVRAYEGGPNGLSPALSTAAQPPAFVMVGDFNGDGYWDTIGPDCTNDCTVAYGGPSGWGASPTRTRHIELSIIFVGPGNVPGATVVDLNADGYDDLLVSKPGGTSVSWYAGSPTGLSAGPDVILAP